MKNIYTILFFMLLSNRFVAQAVVSDNNNNAGVTGNAATLTITSFTVPANSNRLLVACTVNISNQNPPTLTFNSTASKVVSVSNKGTKGSLKVYPTLVKDILTVATEEVGNYQVINLLGQQLFKHPPIYFTC